jgi:hypothetical protein
VHPTALFTLEEFKAPINNKYVQLLNNRRQLSLVQFENFRKWALDNGLKPDFTELEFVSFYFQWGICGLNTTILTKKIKEYRIRLDVFANDVDVQCTGFWLIDRFQQTYPTPGTEMYTLVNPKEAASISRRLKGDEVAVVKVARDDVELVEEWQTTDTNIRFSTGFLLIGEMYLNSLYPRGKFGNLYPKYWNSAAEEEMHTDMFLWAIATEFIDKRRVRVDVSSYRALCECGCSPLAALLYISNAYNEYTAEPLAIGQSKKITPEVIIKYLRGEEVDEHIQTLLEDIMEGVTNTDEVEKGLAADSSQSADKVYTMLYCAHHILKIPVKEIYSAVAKFDGSSALSFTDGTHTLKVPSHKIDAALTAFNFDKLSYQVAQAKEATSFMYVDLIARELGPTGGDRHVGVRCYTATRSAAISTVLHNIQQVFKEKIEEKIFDPDRQEQWQMVVPCFAVGAFFQGAIYGYYTFPKEITKEVVRLDPDTKLSWRKLFNQGHSVGDTVSISDNILYFGTTKWRWYCANAIIQPCRVVPRRNWYIHETALRAAWYGGADPNSDMDKSLRERELIWPDQYPWETLNRTSPVFTTLGDHELGLVGYMREAEQYLADYDRTKKFIGVPHLLEMQYPLLTTEEEVLPVGQDERYEFQSGRGRTIGYVENSPVINEQEHPPIYPFMGMTAEDFFHTNGDIVLPGYKMGKLISVMNGNSLYVDGKLIQPADIEHLTADEYPVGFICGRKYLVCDVKGDLWVVEV